MAADATSHQFIIDRFEGEFVVVEVGGGQTIDLPRWMVPAGSGPGDVVRVEAGGPDAPGVVKLRLDEAATADRRRLAEDLLRRLRPRDPGGDL